MNKKIINQLLLNGKTSTSKKIWLKSIKSLYKSITKNHKKVIVRAIINIAPLLKVKQLKQKQKRSQPKEFPYIVSDKNRLSTSLSFFLNKTKPKSDTKIHTKLVAELLVTSNNSGAIINEKKSLYEYAFIKKKFFYYR
jgi:small subunit ribosomal protein S7